MKILAALMTTLALAAPAAAATVTVSRTARPVSSDEIAGGAPADGIVNDFYVSADSDLLMLAWLGLDAPLYQHRPGSDSTAPDPELAALHLALTADSYITMPGDTVVLGGGFSGGTGSLWGDLSYDGPQSGFHFARLTTTQAGAMNATLAVLGYDNFPVYVPFAFDMPASTSDLATVNAAPPIVFNYSLDPPPAPPTPPAPIPPPATPTPELPPITFEPPTEPLVIPYDPGWTPDSDSLPSDSPVEEPSPPLADNPNVLTITDGLIAIDGMRFGLQRYMSQFLPLPGLTGLPTLSDSIMDLTTLDLTTAAWDAPPTWTLRLTTVLTMATDGISLSMTNAVPLSSDAHALIPEPPAAYLATLAGLLALAASPRRRPLA